MRLIDADALKLEFMENGDDHTGYEIHRVIDKSPTVDAALVVRGEWIPAPEKGDCIYRCSQCDYEIDSYLCEAKNFCPNCGAMMEES